MNEIEKFADFQLASRAFELMNAGERYRALKLFAVLQYPSITDRWFEAVHQSITGVVPTPKEPADQKNEETKRRL